MTEVSNMVEKQQPVSDNAAHQLVHEDEEQRRGDELLAADEARDDMATNAARRRASLDKEIRAGWQRALGH